MRVTGKADGVRVIGDGQHAAEREPSTGADTGAGIARPLSGTEWLVCATAATGFAFDTYELLMLPLIARPALADLLNVEADAMIVNAWAGRMMYVPALAGGVFGLLGGYLTDRLGRQRVLVWSIALYAVSASAAGYATSPQAFLFWRCCTFAGVCVEYVAAVAWLSELFTDPAQRQRVLGYTQAFASLGGVAVSGAYFVVATHAQSFPPIYGGNEPWRYMLISGLFPAIPLMVVRPFLPESPTWHIHIMTAKSARPDLHALWRSPLRRTTIVTTTMVACAYAASFGAMQQIPRIVPGLEEVRVLSPLAQEQTVSRVQLMQELGGISGRLLLAYLAVVIVKRRRLLWVFQAPGLVLAPAVFLAMPLHGVAAAYWGSFVMGVTIVAQFSFWGNYLPGAFPTHLRGTGESIAANVGGRMIGTLAALLTTSLVNGMPGGAVPIRLSYASAIVALAAFAIGITASRWLPEQTLSGPRPQ